MGLLGRALECGSSPSFAGSVSGRIRVLNREVVTRVRIKSWSVPRGQYRVPDSRCTLVGMALLTRPKRDAGGNCPGRMGV